MSDFKTSKSPSKTLRRYMLPLLSLAVVISLSAWWTWYLLAGDFRHLPEDFFAYGVVEGGDLTVRDIAWHQVGKPTSEYRWVSFIALVENSGDRDLEVDRVQVVMIGEEGDRYEAVPYVYGLYHGFMVIRAGETRSVWAGGIWFPQDSEQAVDWQEAEIIVTAKPLSSDAICRLAFAGSYTILRAEPTSRSGFEIAGVINEGAENPDIWFDDVFVSFFNAEGDFIGRSWTTTDWPSHTFEHTFSVDMRPLSGAPIHELVQGMFVNEEIASFQIDAITGTPGGSCK